jgi:signal peptidase I
MRRHVQKLLNHQRDILAPQAVEAIRSAIADLQKAIADKVDKSSLEKQMENLEKAANKWLKPYPLAAFRENVEVLLVALTVAMGIRTFFLQPFKIPTGSMQPTLFGVTSRNLLNDPGFKIPTGLDRVREWFQGVSYVHVVAQNDGAVERVEPPVRLLIFNIKQTLYLGGQPYTLWFPPDFGGATLEQRAAPLFDRVFRTGEDVVKLRVKAGDHLFVDRASYNFVPPERGEIVVFETKGIPEERRSGPGWSIPPDQFYIKRLVGLGDDVLSITNQYKLSGQPGAAETLVGQLVINGTMLSAATPHFQNVYAFDVASSKSKALQYHENHYYGHAMVGYLAPSLTYHVEPNDYFVMGDNTMNSLDSRYWGGFSQSSVIGKSFFVYWPITDRFGWGYRR